MGNAEEGEGRGEGGCEERKQSKHISNFSAMKFEQHLNSSSLFQRVRNKTFCLEGTIVHYSSYVLYFTKVKTFVK